MKTKHYTCLNIPLNQWRDWHQKLFHLYVVSLGVWSFIALFTGSSLWGFLCLSVILIVFIAIGNDLFYEDISEQDFKSRYTGYFSYTLLLIIRVALHYSILFREGSSMVDWALFVQFSIFVSTDIIMTTIIVVLTFQKNERIERAEAQNKKKKFYWSNALMLTLWGLLLFKFDDYVFGDIGSGLFIGLYFYYLDNV